MKTEAWHRLVVGYIVLLLLGLLVIELRLGPRGGGWRFAERGPSLAAVFNWMFWPARMHYVAAGDLKKNHHLQREDLTFHPDLDKSLYGFLRKPEEIVDRYLSSDIVAGQPLLPANVSSLPPIAPASGTYTVAVHLPLSSSSLKLIEPKSKVWLMPANSTEKLEGTVESGRWEKPVADAKKPEAAAPPSHPQATPLPNR